MPYIPPEVVEQARQIDLLTYLQSCEPQELVRISGNNYTTRTHDSLKISNGKWMWWSQRIGGYNALDYLVNDLIALFTPAGVTSLKENFPDWKQGKTIIAAFGEGTIRALEEAGYRVDIEAGQGKPFASLPMAIADYLDKNQ